MNFATIRLRMAIALALSLLLFAALAQAAQPIYELRVHGLACPFCAYGVEKKLGAIEGVQRIRVDIATGTVTVTMAEGAVLEETDARHAVTKAGFSLRGFRQVQPAPSDVPQKGRK